MKKYLMLYAVAVTAALMVVWRHYHGENQRLARNQEALASEITLYRTQAGEEAASAQVLRLRCAEFERLRAEDAEEIRRLGIRLRRLEASARTATASTLEIRTPLRDSLIVRRDTSEILSRSFGTRLDSLHTFRWSDPWVRIEGSIHSVDTLRQIVHRIPHRFLFIRWGTKALRQEIVSQNPHTRIVYTEYIRIER